MTDEEGRAKVEFRFLSDASLTGPFKINFFPLVDGRGELID